MVTVAVILGKTEKLIPSIVFYQQELTLNTATITQAICLTWLRTAAKARIPVTLPVTSSSCFLGSFALVHTWWIIHGYAPGRISRTWTHDVAPVWRSQQPWQAMRHVGSCWNYKYLLISRLDILFNDHVLKWVLQAVLVSFGFFSRDLHMI